MSHSAVTQVDAFSLSVTMAADAPPDVLEAVEVAASLAARRMGHTSVRTVIMAGNENVVIRLERLLPAKGMFVTAAEVRRAVDARLARLT